MRTQLLLLGIVMMNMATASWAQTATLHAVEENGPRSQRINIVFLSEGYTTTDMPNFATHVSNAVNFLFTREPWQQYRSYCNVYRIEIASNQSGCDYGNTSGPSGTRDTYFNTGFWSAGQYLGNPSYERVLTFGTGGGSKALTLLNYHVPEYDVPVVLVNDTKYGGAGGSISLASVHASSSAVVEHEIGHSFALLADEYDYDYPPISPSEKPNNTAQTTRALIRWNHWIEAATPIPTPEDITYDSLVGLFEGSMYRIAGQYRPHYNSLMKSLNRPCGQVNREQFVKQFYTRVSPLDGFTPSNTSATIAAPTALSFQVTPKVPSSGLALQVSWYVDGVLRVGQTTSQLTTLSDYLGNGAHTITATVQDPTPFVRLDPTGLLNESVTWNLTLSGQIPGILAAWRTAYGNDADVSSPDRLPNLVKYALGLAASTPAAAAETPAGSTTTESSQRYLTLTVPRRMRRSDVSYTVEVSSNLSLWQSGAGHTVTLQDDETQLIVRDALPITGDQQRFIRLAVQPLP